MIFKPDLSAILVEFQLRVDTFGIVRTGEGWSEKYLINLARSTFARIHCIHQVASVGGQATAQASDQTARSADAVCLLRDLPLPCATPSERRPLKVRYGHRFGEENSSYLIDPDQSAAAPMLSVSLGAANSYPWQEHAMMDKDRIAGSAKVIKGSVKEAIGKATGDAKLKTEGRTDKLEGKVQNAIGSVKDTVRDALKK
jgi:uncharacterized protein YjbJ (UPF0337 family)